jgi:hypothetical protein
LAGSTVEAHFSVFQTRPCLGTPASPNNALAPDGGPDGKFHFFLAIHKTAQNWANRPTLRHRAGWVFGHEAAAPQSFECALKFHPCFFGFSADADMDSLVKAGALARIYNNPIDTATDPISLTVASCVARRRSGSA